MFKVGRHISEHDRWPAYTWKDDVGDDDDGTQSKL